MTRTKVRPTLKSLPQDSVLRAHLRRQADWPTEGPRLSRRNTGKRQQRDMLAEIDRIGRANHLAGQAAAMRRAAAELREAANEAHGTEHETMRQRAEDLAQQAAELEADAQRFAMAANSAAPAQPTSRRRPLRRARSGARP